MDLSTALADTFACGAQSVTFAREDDVVRCTINQRFHGRGSSDEEALESALVLWRAPTVRYQVGDWPEAIDGQRIALVSARGSRSLEPGTRLMAGTPEQGFVLVVASCDVAANTIIVIGQASSLRPGDWLEVVR